LVPFAVMGTGQRSIRRANCVGTGSIPKTAARERRALIFAAGVSVNGVRWRGRLVCAVDGTILGCPDAPANLTVYQRGGSYNGGTGYPLARVLALVACGTRTIIDATFGTDRVGETSYAHHLLPALHTGMIVLADRNFAARHWLIAVADTGADLLVRVKIGRNLPVCRRLADGSYLSRIGSWEIRVITATITVTTNTGHRSETYRLITPWWTRPAGRRDRRALPPAMGDRDRVLRAQVDHPGRAGATRPHPRGHRAGDLRAADQLPNAAARDQ
jgi:hypothetical protein